MSLKIKKQSVSFILAVCRHLPICLFKLIPALTTDFIILCIKNPIPNPSSFNRGQLPTAKALHPSTVIAFEPTYTHTYSAKETIILASWSATSADTLRLLLCFWLNGN